MAVPPGVAGEFKSVCLERIRDLGRVRNILFIAEIRMGIEPGLLIGAQMVRIPRLVNGIGAVAEDAVVAGQRFHDNSNWQNPDTGKQNRIPC